MSHNAYLGGLRLLDGPVHRTIRGSTVVTVSLTPAPERALGAGTYTIELVKPNRPGSEIEFTNDLWGDVEARFGVEGWTR